jgi:hypothetical protein
MSISYHYSTCLSFIFSISFHISIYFSVPITIDVESSNLNICVDNKWFLWEDPITIQLVD